MNKYKRNIFYYVVLGLIFLLADNISNLFCRSSIVFLCCIIFSVLQEYIKYLKKQESDLLYAVDEIGKMKKINEIMVNILSLLFGPCFQAIMIVGLTMLL
ncbi:MAG: hypothetical protein Q4F05_05730 [bacterium]|nr:hypothetical protein [bacterium]